NNGVVVFDQASNGTYAGSMTGTGSLTKLGAGTLTLSGVNTYSGGTLISAGGLIGTTSSLQGFIVNNGSLTFDQATNGTFGGIISGIGTVTKLGSGNVTFTGLNTYTGLTTVGQGTLTLLNGGMPGSVSVGTQATLSGTGLIGGNVTLGGTLFLPGVSSAAAASGFFSANRFRSAAIAPFAARDAPALGINGDLLANQGSRLVFSVTPGGATPILINGRATLVGGALNVTINDPNPSRNATYTALTAVNGLSVTGLGVTSASTSILPVLSQSQNSLLLTILNLNVPTTSIATTVNGKAAAEGIDAVKHCTTGDLCDVVKEVLTLNGQELDNALLALSGEIHASSLRLQANDSRTMMDLVRNNLSD